MNGASLAPGTLFASDFEIVRRLSTGGMGSVYVARQKSTGKERALKLMLPQLVADPDLRRRFKQEAHIASLINSDHVVEVVGAGVDEAHGVPWLAMELLDGVDLDTAIRERGPMSYAEARRVLEELCHAVGAAHKAGIIHRDIKPENIFLARSKSAKGAEVTKVLDFGIAKIAVDAATKHTGAMGSPLWMAPEQTERSGITPAADVWAIGLVAFFMFTGRSFWLAAAKDDPSVHQIMREVLFDPIPQASERARELGVGDRFPEKFDGWFARCIARAPAARIRNAADAFAQFVELRDARFQNIAETPISSAPRVIVRSSRPQLDEPEGTTLPAGPTLFEAMPASEVRSDRDTTQARERGGGTSRVAWIAAALVAVAVAVVGVRAWLAPHDAPPPVRVEERATLELPPELAATPGAAWFTRVRARCNPVEVESLLQRDPPPKGTDGVGFSAACLVLAGKLDHARDLLMALPQGDRARGAWPVFEVVHPIADAGDDPSAGPAMRLVLEFWPDNYMALYHAGMSEYRTGDLGSARTHLQRFLVLYKQPTGFTESAKRVLAAIDGPPSERDCEKPLTTDPEGRKVFLAGCPSR